MPSVDANKIAAFLNSNLFIIIYIIVYLVTASQRISCDANVSEKVGSNFTGFEGIFDSNYTKFEDNLDDKFIVDVSVSFANDSATNEVINDTEEATIELQTSASFNYSIKTTISPTTVSNFETTVSDLHETTSVKDAFLTPETEKGTETTKTPETETKTPEWFEKYWKELFEFGKKSNKSKSKSGLANASTYRPMFLAHPGFRTVSAMEGAVEKDEEGKNESQKPVFTFLPGQNPNSWAPSSWLPRKESASNEKLDLNTEASEKTESFTEATLSKYNAMSIEPLQISSKVSYDPANASYLNVDHDSRFRKNSSFSTISKIPADSDIQEVTTEYFKEFLTGSSQSSKKVSPTKRQKLKPSEDVTESYFGRRVTPLTTIRAVSKEAEKTTIPTIYFETTRPLWTAKGSASSQKQETKKSKPKKASKSKKWHGFNDKKERNEEKTKGELKGKKVNEKLNKNFNEKVVEKLNEKTNEKLVEKTNKELKKETKEEDLATSDFDEEIDFESLGPDFDTLHKFVNKKFWEKQFLPSKADTAAKLWEIHKKHLEEFNQKQRDATTTEASFSTTLSELNQDLVKQSLEKLEKKAKSDKSAKQKLESYKSQEAKKELSLKAKSNPKLNGTAKSPGSPTRQTTSPLQQQNQVASQVISVKSPQTPNQNNRESWIVVNKLPSPPPSLLDDKIVLPTFVLATTAPIRATNTPFIHNLIHPFRAPNNMVSGNEIKPVFTVHDIKNQRYLPMPAFEHFPRYQMIYNYHPGLKNDFVQMTNELMQGRPSQQLIQRIPPAYFYGHQWAPPAKTEATTPAPSTTTARPYYQLTALVGQPSWSQRLTKYISRFNVFREPPIIPLPPGLFPQQATSNDQKVPQPKIMISRSWPLRKNLFLPSVLPGGNFRPALLHLPVYKLEKA